MRALVTRDYGSSCCFCFFFSSRRRHTRLQGDWSSDVCSSDLLPHGQASWFGEGASQSVIHADRKSTRLNSSHLVISYAVFCLKKKTTQALNSARGLGERPNRPARCRAVVP